ncbi:hypothetical protein ACGFIF_41940 [Kribbella sp. NPDC049174]|uniref:hypothetical protein n=1 Tax=Kribbella sp. NPDC049174 TaxID=3364112 RepID=UPI003713B343
MTVHQPPEEPTTELIDKLLAGALSSLPVAGGAAGAWYEYLMEGPYNRRLAEWRARITDVVNQLVLKVERLLDNEVFLDAFIQSTRIAQTTHQQEKLEALRNALENSVAPDAPDVDEQARFFRLVDQFSARHILLLRWAQDHPSRRGGPVHDEQRPNAAGIWGYPLPVLDGHDDLRTLLMDDLVSTKLVEAQAGFPRVIDLDDEYFVGEVTPLGRRFLTFISGTDEQGSHDIG